MRALAGLVHELACNVGVTDWYFAAIPASPMFVTRVMADIDLGPVGQSSVSLTSSLRGQLVKCL